MAIRNAYSCDICGKDKQQVNHWWMMSFDGESLHLDPWHEEDAEEAAKHLCGQECVIKAVSEYLSK